MGKPTAGKRRGAAKKNAAVGQVRQVAALQLRLKGLSCREIGERLGISEKNAWKHLRNALAAKDEAVQDLRHLSSRRLDHMLQKLWPRIGKGDPRSVMAGVAVEKRRAALFGLDAPQQLELTGMPLAGATVLFGANLSAWPEPAPPIDITPHAVAVPAPAVLPAAEAIPRPAARGPEPAPFLRGRESSAA